MRSLLLPITGIVVLACCAGSPMGQDIPQVGTIYVENAYDHSGIGVPTDTGTTIIRRFMPPAGFSRVASPQNSFGHYLRHLPLKPEGTPVHLHNGELKWNQRAHAAVVDLSVGVRDLQQCADAVMRLRAEYLFASGSQDEIAFNFTNGFPAEWKRWRSGERIRVVGDRCSWVSNGPRDSSHAALLSYMQQVFTYAGTLSLAQELQPAAQLPLEAGDVFIHGGSPGHAVIVVDVASNSSGQQIFMLAQSYMPAQDIHVLRNLKVERLSPWFMLQGADKLYTPEWTFEWSDRKRWP